MSRFVRTFLWVSFVCLLGSLSLRAKSPPTASLSVNDTTPDPLQSITLTGSYTSDSADLDLATICDMGTGNSDGSSGSCTAIGEAEEEIEGDSDSITRDFTIPLGTPSGSYTFRTDVEDRFGQSDSDWEVVTVRQVAPVASISVSDTTPAPGQKITINGYFTDDNGNLDKATLRDLGTGDKDGNTGSFPAIGTANESISGVSDLIARQFTLPSNTATGSYTFRADVEDGSYYLSDKEWVVVTVTAASSPSAENKLKIERKVWDTSASSYSVVKTYKLDSSTNNVLTLSEGEGTTVLRYTKDTVASTSGGNTRTTEVKKTSASTSTVVAKTKRTYTNYGSGASAYKELTELKRNPDSSSQHVKTSYTYYTSSSVAGTYRKLKSVTHPSGGWRQYQYYTTPFQAQGLIHRIHQPHEDSPSTAGTGGTGRVTTYTYATSDPKTRHLPASIEVTIGGTATTPVAKSTFTYTTNTTSNERGILKTTRKDYYGSGTNDYVQTELKHYQEKLGSGEGKFEGQLYSVKNPDKSQRSYLYEEGSYNPSNQVFTAGSGDALRIRVFNGSSDSSAGTLLSSYSGETIESIRMIANKSTLEVTIRDAKGRVVRDQTWVYTGGTAFSFVSWSKTTYDGAGHATEVKNSDSSKYTATWTEGKKSSETSISGTVTNYQYDELGRVTKATVAAATDVVGTLDVPAVERAYSYDAANRVTKREVGATSKITTTYSYDLAGRLTEEKEYATVSNGSGTGYVTAYSYNSNGRQSTATHPDDGTTIRTIYRDGRIKSLTGTAVVEQQYDYVKNSNGTRYTKVTYGGGTVRYVKSTVDWLGRPTKEEQPTFDGGDAFARNYHYNGTTGQLSKISETDLADTLFVYNTLGQQVRRGLDVSNNGSLDNNSADRISETGISFVSLSSKWWLQTIESVYGITGAGNASGTKKTVSKTQVRLTGYNSSSDLVSEAKHYDINGNITVEKVEIDRSKKKRTVKVDHPHASSHSVSIYGNDRLLKVTPADGTSSEYEYDGWGRQSKLTDGRIGATTTTYLAGTGLVDEIDRPGPDDLAYAYDSDGRLSRIDEVKVPGTTPTYISTYQEYNKRGQVLKRWGSAVMPIEYTYHADYGHRTHQKTYRGGSGWETSSTWPSSPGTADTTEYTVHLASGLLQKEKDPGDKEIEFEYYDRGQLKKRILARDSSGNATTNYQYDSKTAELTKEDYPSAMTDIEYTYTRLGTVKSVDDATGERSFTFRTSDFQLESEQLPSAFYGSTRYLSPVYSTATGSKGRLTGLKYGTAVGNSSALSVTYGYEAATGRLSSVGAHNQTMTYAYLANSNRVSTVSSGTSGDYYTLSRVWESDRNLLTSVETQWGTTSKALHYYQYDALNRRTAEYKRGEMFDIYDDDNAVGIGRKYAYDDKTGLTSAIDYLDPDADYQATDLTTRVKGRRFAYAYDNQGNRTTDGTTVNYRESGESNLRQADYTVNSRNQYSQRQVPAFVDVAGAATSTPTVSGNNVSHTVTQQGDYFYSLLDDNGGDGYDNSSDDLKVSVTVSTGGELNEGDVHIAEDVEVLSYDDDGNLTGDGLWDYVWDAENQLTSMTMKTGLPTGITRERIEFKYDYARRRVEKKVIDNWDGSSGTTIAHLKYVYDGHNLIAELNGSNNTVLTTYVWGLDLSGTIHGAGGVGGLLMIKEGSKVYFPGYDGIGNVSGLVDSADGSLDAKYEYGAFGEPLRVGGTAIADDNPFRFSTKYLDSESGLIYYGFRYYSPSLGRFLNRDPIGEAGGQNLYGFVGNDPVNNWDYLGMEENEDEECVNPDDPDCIEELPDFPIKGERDWSYQDLKEVALSLINIPGSANVDRTDYTEIATVGGNGGGSGGGGTGTGGKDGCEEPKKEEDKKCYAYVSIDPVTGAEKFFTLTDVDLSTREEGDLHGLKVAAPSGFDIQAMVDSHGKASYPTIWHMYQWGTDPDNNPKTINPIFQNAGNLAYGAVGSALGIELDELNQAAGVLQQGESKKIWGDRSSRRMIPSPVPGRQGFDFFSGGTSPYYGNDPVDHHITQDGYSAVEQGKKIEKREVPCEEVGL